MSAKAEALLELCEARSIFLLREHTGHNDDLHILELLGHALKRESVIYVSIQISLFLKFSVCVCVCLYIGHHPSLSQVPNSELADLGAECGTTCTDHLVPTYLRRKGMQLKAMGRVHCLRVSCEPDI